jgi:hypothetical protein
MRFRPLFLLSAICTLHAAESTKPPAEDPTRSNTRSEPKQVSGSAAQPVSLFYSSGDAVVVYPWLPMDSEATCQASMEVLKQRYHCDRLLWREASTEWGMRWAQVREDSPWLGDMVSETARINREFQTTLHASRAAAAQGIAFWGVFHFFDYCGKAECMAGGSRGTAAFWGRDPWMEQHPEHRVWDRARITYMSGIVEYGEPAVRAEHLRRVEAMFAQEWRPYAGIFMHTYIENMEASYTDQYIYSDYAVADFKKRYGVDVRTQPFDLEAYYAMRGSYITQLLRELRPIFKKHGKQLAMILNAENMDWPQAWLAGRAVWPKDATVPYTLQQGRLHMDWRTWVKEGLVDELHVWAGAHPDQKIKNVRALLAATAGSGVKITVSFQTELPEADRAELYAQGVRRVISVDPGNEEGTPGSYTAADLASADAGVVLRVLAQARAGELVLPVDRLSALLVSHANPLVRRQVAATLASLKLAAALPALEAAARAEKEGSVLAMIFDALGKVNGPGTLAALADGFARVNTFPVRMALRNALAAMPPERTADLIRAYDTPDSYFRRVLAESLTRRNNPPEIHDLLRRSIRDAHPKVRWWSAYAYAYVRYTEETGETLLAALQDENGAVQSRAAMTLRDLAPKLSPTLKQRFFTRLLATYLQFATGSQRADAEWGWRPIGETLRDSFGEQGRSALLAILNTGEPGLASLTWRVFFQPNENAWHIIAPQDMERRYRFHPGGVDAGKCTLADLAAAQPLPGAKPAADSQGAAPQSRAPGHIHVGKDVATIAEAIQRAQPGDTIHLEPKRYYETADLSRKHGLEGKPIILDGHGAVLDGSEPIQPADWEALAGDLYRKTHLLPRMDEAILARWFFLFDGRIERMGRCSKGPSQPLRPPDALEPGQWTYVNEEDAFYLRLPAGQKLAEAQIRYPLRSSGVAQSIEGSWQTVRNLTCTHFYNDGFNVHGAQRHLVYENIAAIECGDDGFSAHEDADCTINGFTSLRNATGLCDTVSSTTRYRDVFIRDCAGYDLFFIGDSAHSMENVLIESSAARPLEVAQHADRPQAGPSIARLKNLRLSSQRSPAGSIRISRNAKLTMENCTLDGAYDLALTPGGEVSATRCAFLGQPSLLIYPNTLWQGQNNHFSPASLRVGQASFTEKTFAAFQKALASETGSVWSSAKPQQGTGAPELAPLRTHAEALEARWQALVRE